jgi:hypothetical protein
MDAAMMRVGFLRRAVPSCPAPGFPFLEAQAVRATRWIQVVEVNVPPPAELRAGTDWNLVEKPGAWIFLDMEETLRGRGQPFINHDGEGLFWDNPAWLDPPRDDQPSGDRIWRAKSYAIRVSGHELHAVGGVGWGYGWRIGERAPYPIEPTALARSAWAEDAPRLARVAPGWVFVP